MKERRDQIRCGISAIADIQSAIEELLIVPPIIDAAHASDRCRQAAVQLSSAAAFLRAATPTNEPVLIVDSFLSARKVGLRLAAMLKADEIDVEALRAQLERLKEVAGEVEDLARNELAPFLPHGRSSIRLPWLHGSSRQ